MTFREFWQPLCRLYETGEAKAIVRLLLDMKYGLSLADILCGKVEQLETQELQALQARLLTGEPVQYVLGEAEFGGRRFVVNPHVLIPRPETFELCLLVREAVNSSRLISSQWATPDILDIGTGSGCIACTLAADIADADVTAWDISADALAVARENANHTHVHVSFELRDALNLQIPDLSSQTSLWDVIVSNPPYICLQERKTMECNVLDHEPALALFVPDDDPLRFYRSIANYAAKALKSGGLLFFEINPLYASATVQLLRELGFADTTLHNDQNNRQRFISSCKPTKP